MSQRRSTRLLQEGLTDLDPQEVRLEDALCHAALSERIDAVGDVLDDALARDVCRIAFTDVHLAQAVRKLGALWAEDQIGWTDVTIGTARLQSLLRRVALPIDAELARRPDAPRVMLVSGMDMAHTFGPMLLAHQLRRRGVSVALSLETAPGTVCNRFSKTAPDAVFLTASHCDGIEPLAHVVKEVRVFNSGVPIVVGGPLLSTVADVARLTGADYATSDLDEALELCNLTLHPARANANT